MSDDQKARLKEGREETLKDLFDDFNWALKKARDERGESTARRLALHYYCSVIEMSAIHEIIANLLRCVSGQAYAPFPFSALVRKKKKSAPWNVMPPTMPARIRLLKTMAKTLGENELEDALGMQKSHGRRPSLLWAMGPHRKGISGLESTGIYMLGRLVRIVDCCFPCWLLPLHPVFLKFRCQS
jgi:hypothetical protein